MPALSAAGAALTRAVRAAVAATGGAAEIEVIDSRPWASVTFTGERHFLRLRLGGESAAAAADAFLEALAEREFELRGHIVADIALVSRRRDGDTERIALEALTVESS